MNVGPAVSVSGLSYTYPDGTAALKNISLTVDRGERVGIIGANGAGKSTLMLHLNGIIMGNGDIRIHGMPVSNANLREIRRRVGVVFQNPDDQLFCPTVYDDIAFGPRNMGLGEAEIASRVEESLRRVGLNGDAGKSAFHLSMGQKKRAAIASVLSMGPELLALDEPTGSLDPKGRAQIIALLTGLGGTQIIISHDIDLVRRQCQRAVLLSKGEIAADGPVERIVSDVRLLEAHGMT